MIVPIHLQVHWTVAVIDFGLREIIFYDSMGGRGDQWCELPKDYLKEEHMNKKNKPMLDIEEWTLKSPGRKSPQQDNGSDCGVFTCCMAENYSRCGFLGTFNFEAKDMKN